MKLTKSQLKEIIREEITNSKNTISENKASTMVNIIGSFLSRNYQMGQNRSYNIGAELVKIFKEKNLI